MDDDDLAPEWVIPEIVATDAERVTTTKPHVAVDRIRFSEFTEGLSVQTLHVGAYDDEGPRIAPENLKTILRQPVEVVGE